MDYIAFDSQESIYYSLVINDSYFLSNQQSIILNVLDNDEFQEVENVQIVETTQPENGLVIINSDKTLTYYPNPEKIPSEEQATSQDEVSEPIEEPVNNIELAQPEPELPKNIEQVETTQEADEIIIQEKTKDDIFTYTVEIEDEKGEKSTQEAVVKIITDMGESKSFSQCRWIW
ncbi:Ig-like domain-containing protein [Zobellia nedashkovskayae]